MNSNGTKKSKDIDWSDNIYWKYKELEYIVQNLSEFKDYLPGFNTIIEELEQERKNVENSHWEVCERSDLYDCFYIIFTKNI